eukprot:GILI01002941.1.p1 GENE.GILI01002941.1~~GILI01002941.1.p1  ORF type:complete len:140 (-),score=56.04 GILI01002941.1:314-733(-)
MLLMTKHQLEQEEVGHTIMDRMKEWLKNTDYKAESDERLALGTMQNYVERTGLVYAYLAGFTVYFMASASSHPALRRLGTPHRIAIGLLGGEAGRRFDLYYYKNKIFNQIRELPESSPVKKTVMQFYDEEISKRRNSNK